MITDGLFIDRQFQTIDFVTIAGGREAMVVAVSVDAVYRHDGAEWQATAWVGPNPPSMPDIGRWLRGCEWVLTHVLSDSAPQLLRGLGKPGWPPGLDQELDRWFGKGKLNPSRVGGKV